MAYYEFNVKFHNKDERTDISLRAENAIDMEEAKTVIGGTLSYLTEAVVEAREICKKND